MSNAGLSDTQIDTRTAVQAICQRYPDSYWQEKDAKSEYAGDDLHRDLAEAGYLGICMPESVGGVGLGISEAAIMLLTIAESGGGIAAAQTVHANIYATIPVLSFATESQRDRWLPAIIDGSSKTCFGVTEPNSGLNTLALETKAERKGDKYIVNGSKVWITNAQRASRMILLARTATPDSSKRPDQCLSLFYADIKKGKANGQVSVQSIDKMGGRSVDANVVAFDDFEVDVADRIGAEGDGFRHVVHGLNAERCLLSGEALGLGYAALKRATQYAKDRSVFGRAIGQNQAIQHPLAKSWAELEAGKHLLLHAASRFDAVVGIGTGGQGSKVEREEVGAAANAAKYFCAEVGFKACETAVMTHGGMGYSSEYRAILNLDRSLTRADVERYLREAFVPRLAPVSRELILSYIGQRVLGLPKSY